MCQAKKVYNAFNEDWVEHDYPKALTLITPDLDPDAAHQSFLNFFQLLEGRVGHLRSFKSGGINAEENAAGSRTTIHAHLTLNHGELDFVYVLKKYQDRWYIDKIDQD